MGQVTVFVDDAVLGHLPQVCVKDGTPTNDSMVLRTQVATGNGLGIAWLLLLAGPLGWLGLLIVAASRRSADILTVRLPMSEAAFQRLRDARRDGRVAGMLALAFGVTATVAASRATFDARFIGAVFGVLCLVGIVWWVVELRRVRRWGVDVDLDASRRWVMLSRVHPSFVQSIHDPSPRHQPWLTP